MFSKEPSSSPSTVVVHTMSKTPRPKIVPYTEIQQQNSRPKTLQYAEIQKQNSRPKTVQYAEIQKQNPRPRTIVNAEAEETRILVTVKANVNK